MKSLVISDELIEQFADDYHLNPVKITFEQFLENELVRLMKILE